MNIRFLAISLLLSIISITTSAQGTKEAYTVLKDGTLTFYYNDSKPANAKQIQSSRKDADWPEHVRNSVFKVVFDPSFKDYKPTNCTHWFWTFSNLCEISGMKEYLNTENVTDMSCMFYGCKFKSLDLSSFNNKKVTTMSCMFKHSKQLETIVLTSFNTKNVTDMAGMFEDCASLTNIDLGNFNTSSVTTMKCMFHSCVHLTSLDLSSFDTKNVNDFDYMFQYSSNLRTIYVGDGWQSDKDGTAMFYDCNNLFGGKGTAYNEDYTDATYAIIDGGEDSPGYFTKYGEPAYIPDDADTPSSIKIWSSNHTIHIESDPGTKCTIINLTGKTKKSSAVQSLPKEIKINQKDIVIVIINGESYKLSL